MSSFLDHLEVGQSYDRKTLARLWNLASFHAIGRGVFTPKGTGQIFLFVTREREGWMTPYNNFLYHDLLIWDGEKGHGSDRRITQAISSGEQILLFYREHRRDPFTFYGKIFLIRFELFKDRPSEFVFRVVSIMKGDEPDEVETAADQEADFAVLSRAGMGRIDRWVPQRSRGIAQRLFRGNLLRLWQGSCAVTGVQEPRVLRASHIKPWAKSCVSEKVDHFNGLLLVPNLDALFNDGLISFQNDGRILISPDWRPDDQRRMNINGGLQLHSVHPESHPYLEFHRDVIFPSPRKAGAVPNPAIYSARSAEASFPC